MKVRSIFTVIVITTVLLFFNQALASAMMPVLPSSFWGTVKWSGANTPLDSVISARINGVQYAATPVMVYNSDTVYSLDVAGDDPETAVIEGGVEGDTITFYVDGLPAGQTAVWHSGTNNEHNLTLTANHAPVITEGASTTVTMSEDGLPTAFALTLHGTDFEGGTLTWSISTAASHGAAAAAGTGSSKVISYAPVGNFNGSDSFKVQVSDGNGGVDAVIVNVTVSAVNDAPTAADDTYTVQVNTALVVAAKDGVLKNDGDVDLDVLSAIVQTAPTHGTLALKTDGSFTYTPEAGYSSGDRFTYKVYDGKAYSSESTVNIVFGSIPVTGLDGIFIPLMVGN